MKRKIALFSLIVAVALVCSGTLFAQGASEPKADMPKVLRYATVSEPPSLDQQVLTSDQATTIAQHVFEGLYTFNSTYDPVPMLVESDSVSADGTVITMNLRKGVTFHNGKEMTSEDVVASLNRWGKYGTRGGVLFSHVKDVVAESKYVVKINLTDAFAPWKALLAFINGGPVIYPSEIASKATKEPIAETEYIGTGPYKFVERSAGRHILLEKYENYAARTDASDGYAGNRVANFDKIYFIPVPDVGTRVNGVKAGDYDYAEQISGDLFDMLDEDPSVETIVNQGVIQPLMFFNSNAGIFKNNSKLRQAVLACLDMDSALATAVGPDSLWVSNGSIMPEATSWYTTAGTDLYNLKSAAKAQELAKEAGYNGEKITFMVSSAYQIHNDIGIVFARLMKQAGFNVDLQVYDWATLISKRGDASQWDIFFTHHGFVPDPILYSFMSDSYPGWWATDEKHELVSEFTKTMDATARMNVWVELQKLVYEQMPIVKIGDVYNYDIYSPKLTGFGSTQLIWPKFWGVDFK